MGSRTAEQAGAAHDREAPRIVFASSSDPLDMRSFSTVLVHMVGALRELFPGLEIVRQWRPRWFERVQDRLLRWTHGRINLYYWKPINRLFAALLWERWHGRRTIVIGVVVGPLVAELATRMPVINITDATFVLMRNFYENYDAMGPTTARGAERAERESIQRAVHNSFSSEWAARSAIADYGADPEEVSVISWGCNLPPVPLAEVARPYPRDICRLLFIGGDWKRKGGDIVLEAAALLRARGLPVTVDLVGSAPPADAAPDPGVVHHGFLSKSNPDDYARLLALYRSASFLLLPTMQDCTPMVFAETNAFGVPGITRDTGGVASVVEDGVNGYVLPFAASAADFADRIEAAWNDADGYNSLRASSRRTYEERLNWPAWAAAIRNIIIRLEEQGRL